jgi:hypothetical protein
MQRISTILYSNEHYTSTSSASRLWRINWISFASGGGNERDEFYFVAWKEQKRNSAGKSLLLSLVITSSPAICFTIIHPLFERVLPSVGLFCWSVSGRKKEMQTKCVREWDEVWLYDTVELLYPPLNLFSSPIGNTKNGTWKEANHSFTSKGRSSSFFRLCGVANANVTKETLHNLIIKNNLNLNQLQTTGFGIKRMVNESELLLNCLIF